MKILIMGLPGSGKTILAKLLVPALNAVWLNADKVREEANDWDFSEKGRMRQAERMRLLSVRAISENRVVVADFICPTHFARKEFDADYTIWMDTIKKGRFEDTNNLFEPPENPDFICKHFDAQMWSYLILQEVRDLIQEEKENEE